MQAFLDLTKALGDQSRVRAVMALEQGELCLCQLIELLELAPSTVSKHMTQLQQAGLVRRRKEGRWHFYRLAGEDAPAAVRQTLGWTLESLDDDPIVVGDRERLKSVCRKDLEELSACYRN
jgi:ArsR family transcriptional regulator